MNATTSVSAVAITAEMWPPLTSSATIGMRISSSALLNVNDFAKRVQTPDASPCHVVEDEPLLQQEVADDRHLGGDDRRDDVVARRRWVSAHTIAMFATAPRPPITANSDILPNRSAVSCVRKCSPWRIEAFDSPA